MASDTEVVVIHDNEGDEKVDNDSDNSDDELPSEQVTADDQQLPATQTLTTNQKQEKHAHKRQCTIEISQGDTMQLLQIATLRRLRMMTLNLAIHIPSVQEMQSAQRPKSFLVSKWRSAQKVNLNQLHRPVTLIMTETKLTILLKSHTDNKNDLQGSSAKRQSGPIQSRPICLKRTRQSADEDELCSAKKLKPDNATKTNSKKRGRESDDDDLHSGITKQEKTIVMNSVKGLNRLGKLTMMMRWCAHPLQRSKRAYKNT